MSLVIFKTVFSNMMIEENNGKITKILFTKRKLKSTKNSNLLKAKKEILEYLNQQRMRFSFLIEPSGTDFQKKVWKQISTIKYGQTATYSDVAKKVNNAPRAVGNACGANPCLLIIPCHRVISKSGNIGGFSSFGGIVQKDRLLSLEVN
tara:strand:- start:195 stop:641 length:447 start_codon:yes stop_codon:yes gene_type:complete